MDYSPLSDFEVNKLVSARLWGSVCSVDGVVLHNDKDGAFDPCNNPADAWPIIVDNGIAIIPDSTNGEWVSFNEFTLYEGDWMFASDPARHINGKNPLRAAMIVFLMMQENNGG